MATAKALLDIARGELGAREVPMNSNNVKYNTAYYGQAVHDGLWGTTFAWCVVFVWWCFQQAGAAELFYGGGKTASCTALRDWAKRTGGWVTGGYRPGDIAIYDWHGDGKPDHCGIIETVGGSSVVAIEGNTAIGNDSNGGEVMRRTRTLSDIMGAVRPAYEEEPMDNTPSPAHKAAVEWAVANGILQGGTDGDLRLSEPVTRQQMCTFLKRMYDLMEGK